MPIFEYVCDECSNSFEALVMNDKEASCPACNSTHLSKQYSRFSAGTNSGPYQSLPLYKGGGCGCTPSSCGCKN